MKTLRRITFIIAFLAGIVYIIWLLNFTAPNPTGRRYSSQTPLTTGQATGNKIGLDGERILAADLHLPRNDAPDQLQCICNSLQYSNRRNCNACIAAAPLSAQYRRPDFVGPNFIAEAKNTQNLLYESRDLEQIRDFVTAAKALKRPLWVFTRVNTEIDSEFSRIVETTGGGVVPYFTVPGYVDPVDRAAKAGIAGSLCVMLFIGVWEFRVRPRPVRNSIPVTAEPPNDHIGQAKDAITQAEKFVKDSKDKQRRKI